MYGGETGWRAFIKRSAHPLLPLPRFRVVLGLLLVFAVLVIAPCAPYFTFASIHFSIVLSLIHQPLVAPASDSLPPLP